MSEARETLPENADNALLEVTDATAGDAHTEGTPAATAEEPEAQTATVEDLQEELVNLERRQAESASRAAKRRAELDQGIATAKESATRAAIVAVVEDAPAIQAEQQRLCADVVAAVRLRDEPQARVDAAKRQLHEFVSTEAARRKKLGLCAKCTTPSPGGCCPSCGPSDFNAGGAFAANADADDPAVLGVFVTAPEDQTEWAKFGTARVRDAARELHKLRRLAIDLRETMTQRRAAGEVDTGHHTAKMQDLNGRIAGLEKFLTESQAVVSAEEYAEATVIPDEMKQRPESGAEAARLITAAYANT